MEARSSPMSTSATDRTYARLWSSASSATVAALICSTLHRFASTAARRLRLFMVAPPLRPASSCVDSSAGMFARRFAQNAALVASPRLADRSIFSLLCDDGCGTNVGC
eukprot:4824230-Prymnesium_polylepis.3